MVAQLTIPDVGTEPTYLPNEWAKHISEFYGTIPILSFFTGAGFLDLGFEQENFHAIWHNEYDRQFVDGFTHGMTHVLGKPCTIENTESIVDIGPNQIAREAFGRKTRPAVFGIIGGPPCPDFSIGGKNRGEHGDHGKLTQVYANRICELGPSFFVLENVKGLIKTALHRRFLSRIIRQFENAGYVVDFRVLNALDFGVPQDRERVFVVGFKKKFLRKTARSGRGWFPWPTDMQFVGAKKRYNWPTVHPFGSNPARPEGVPYDLTVWSALHDTDYLRRLPNGTDCFIAYSQKFHSIMEGDSSRKSFKRLHRWRFSPTAAYGNNEVHLHPTLPRRLSVREALRLQTAPDQYSLPADMPLSCKFKTIGNAVPVKLARALAYAVRVVLES